MARMATVCPPLQERYRQPAKVPLPGLQGRAVFLVASLPMGRHGTFLASSRVQRSMDMMRSQSEVAIAEWYVQASHLGPLMTAVRVSIGLERAQDDAALRRPRPGGTATWCSPAASRAPTARQPDTSRHHRYCRERPFRRPGCQSEQLQKKTSLQHANQWASPSGGDD